MVQSGSSFSCPAPGGSRVCKPGLCCQPLEQLELFMTLLCLPSGHTHLPQARSVSPRSASGRLGMTVCFPVLVQGTDPLLVLFLLQHTGDCCAGGGNVTQHAPVREPSLTFFKMHTESTQGSALVPGRSQECLLLQGWHRRRRKLRDPVD